MEYCNCKYGSNQVLQYYCLLSVETNTRLFLCDNVLCSNFRCESKSTLESLTLVGRFFRDKTVERRDHDKTVLPVNECEWTESVTTVAFVLEWVAECISCCPPLERKATGFSLFASVIACFYNKGPDIRFAVWPPQRTTRRLNPITKGETFLTFTDIHCAKQKAANSLYLVTTAPTQRQHEFLSLYARH